MAKSIELLRKLLLNRNYRFLPCSECYLNFEGVITVVDVVDEKGVVLVVSPNGNAFSKSRDHLGHVITIEYIFKNKCYFVEGMMHTSSDFKDLQTCVEYSLFPKIMVYLKGLNLPLVRIDLV